jgi:hypothetical protein
VSRLEASAITASRRVPRFEAAPFAPDEKYRREKAPKPVLRQVIVRGLAWERIESQPVGPSMAMYQAGLCDRRSVFWSGGMRKPAGNSGSHRRRLSRGKWNVHRCRCQCLTDVSAVIITADLAVRRGAIPILAKVRSGLVRRGRKDRMRLIGVSRPDIMNVGYQPSGHPERDNGQEQG